MRIDLCLALEVGQCGIRGPYAPPGIDILPWPATAHAPAREVELHHSVPSRDEAVDEGSRQGILHATPAANHEDRWQPLSVCTTGRMKGGSASIPVRHERGFCRYDAVVCDVGVSSIGHVASLARIHTVAFMLNDIQHNHKQLIECCSTRHTMSSMNGSKRASCRRRAAGQERHHGANQA